MTNDQFVYSVREKIHHIAAQPPVERDAWMLAASEVILVERFSAHEKTELVDAEAS